MMIGSGPAVICRPSSFLTELLLSLSLQLLQYAYALIVEHVLHCKMSVGEYAILTGRRMFIIFQQNPSRKCLTKDVNFTCVLGGERSPDELKFVSASK